MAKNKGDAGNIITYDPYLQTSYAFSNNKIYPVELSKANKNSFFISYIKYKDITIGSVEIPISTEEDDTSNTNSFTMKFRVSRRKLKFSMYLFRMFYLSTSCLLWQ